MVLKKAYVSMQRNVKRKVGLMALLARTQCAKKKGLSNYSVQLHSDDYCIHAYFFTYIGTQSTPIFNFFFCVQAPFRIFSLPFGSFPPISMPFPVANWLLQIYFVSFPTGRGQSAGPTRIFVCFWPKIYVKW